MPVNSARLTDAEVRASLAQMEQAITMQGQAMTDQVNRQNIQRENPPVCSMDDRLRDFTRMNPPIFTGSKTSEDPQDFVDEVHKILVAMGATDTEKAEDEMSKFFTRITVNLEEECRSAMLHDKMDLSKLMVHVPQVDDSRKKRGVRDARRFKPYDQAGPSNGGNRNNFGIREHPRLKKGQQSSGNSNFQRNTAARGGRLEPKKGNGGDMQHP
ncbi:uncharacterized protein LOC107016782 [Solanum pennellii]|uniref:Uncharacterized protein LOC107016782 n=1 Tax=Solanum pennellii TaxID=28526 RepID=A0ABM1GL17_SOLPN|nr:uncharacterized protein LOC107016782 [Solanum pennellii]